MFDVFKRIFLIAVISKAPFFITGLIVSLLFKHIKYVTVNSIAIILYVFVA